MPASEVAIFLTQSAEVALNRYPAESYLAARCAAVLLASDSPGVGIELARKLLPKHLYAGGDLIIRALGKCKTPAAAQLLRELLAESDVRAHRYSEVVGALAAHASADANNALLAELDTLDTETADDPHAPRRALSSALFRAADESPTLLNALRDRLSTLHSSHAMELATEAIGLLVANGHTGGATVSDLLPSIDDSRQWPVPFHVQEAVERAFVEHRPSGASMFVLVPRPNQKLRADLFELMRHDRTRSLSARRLLLLVENARVEHGRPEDEPRHPVYGKLDPAIITWSAPRGSTRA